MEDSACAQQAPSTLAKVMVEATSSALSAEKMTEIIEDIGGATDRNLDRRMENSARFDKRCYPRRLRNALESLYQHGKAGHLKSDKLKDLLNSVCSFYDPDYRRVKATVLVALLRHSACEGDFGRELVGMVIDAGADPNLGVDAQGQVPLIDMDEYGLIPKFCTAPLFYVKSAAMAELLFHRGARPEVHWPGGYTLLHRAMDARSVDVHTDLIPWCIARGVRPKKDEIFAYAIGENINVCASGMLQKDRVAVLLSCYTPPDFQETLQRVEAKKKQILNVLIQEGQRAGCGSCEEKLWKHLQECCEIIKGEAERQRDPAHAQRSIKEKYGLLSAAWVVNSFDEGFPLSDREKRELADNKFAENFPSAVLALLEAQASSRERTGGAAAGSVQ